MPCHGPWVPGFETTVILPATVAGTGVDVAVTPTATCSDPAPGTQRSLQQTRPGWPCTRLESPAATRPAGKSPASGSSQVGGCRGASRAKRKPWEADPSSGGVWGDAQQQIVCPTRPSCTKAHTPLPGTPDTDAHTCPLPGSAGRGRQGGLAWLPQASCGSLARAVSPAPASHSATTATACPPAAHRG